MLEFNLVIDAKKHPKFASGIVEISGESMAEISNRVDEFKKQHPSVQFRLAPKLKEEVDLDPLFSPNYRRSLKEMKKERGIETVKTPPLPEIRLHFDESTDNEKIIVEMYGCLPNKVYAGEVLIVWVKTWDGWITRDQHEHFVKHVGLIKKVTQKWFDECKRNPSEFRNRRKMKTTVTSWKQKELAEKKKKS